MKIKDVQKSQWQAISNMSTRRSSVGVGVVGSFLYSVGGYDGHSRKNSNTFTFAESARPAVE